MILAGDPDRALGGLATGGGIAPVYSSGAATPKEPAEAKPCASHQASATTWPQALSP